MISVVRGVLLERDPASITVDVGGVGLLVFVPGRGALGRVGVGSEIRVHTHLHVRENALDLYGFETADERALFRAFLSVSGIGPRTALAILSSLSADDAVVAIQAADADAFRRAPGVGKKTAQRILLELSEKFDLTGQRAESGAVVAAVHDAILGLVTLGYAESAAQKAVTEARSRVASDASAGDLMRESLKGLSRS